MKLTLPIDSGYYISDSSSLSYSETVNLYSSHPAVEGGTSRGALFTFPGGKIFSSEINVSSKLGFYEFNDILYVVTQDGLYSVDADGVWTELGRIPDLQPTDLAIIDDNGVNMCIVFPGKSAYVYEPGLGLERLLSDAFTSFGPPTSVAYSDGRYFFTTDTKIFWGSLVTDNAGKNFNAFNNLQPFLKEKAVRIVAISGELLLFGQDTLKFYVGTPDQDLPIQEIEQSFFDKGLENRHQVILFNNSFYFIGSGRNERPAIYSGSGPGAIQKISTDSIDRNITEQYLPYTYSFMLNGRAFVGFLLGTSCFYYDLQSSAVKGFPEWIKVADSGISGIIGTHIAEAYGKVLYLGSNIYELTMDDASFGTDDITREVRFTSQYIYNGSDNFSINRLELVMETGAGRNPDSYTTSLSPEVLLEYSDDGGRNWINCGSKTAGRHGINSTRLVWHRLGLARQSRVFRFTSKTGVTLRFHRLDLYMSGGIRNA